MSFKSASQRKLEQAMEMNMFTHYRRDLLTIIAASMMASLLAGKCPAAFADSKESLPERSISVRVTAADKRYALAEPLRWQHASGKPGTNAIVIFPTKK